MSKQWTVLFLLYFMDANETGFVQGSGRAEREPTEGHLEMSAHKKAPG